MFPLHQSDELVFQISPNPHKNHKISEDLILGHASLDVDVFVDIKKRKPITTNLKNNNYLNFNTNKKKKTATKNKMKHRETERLRRKEMATLYASLRSLLPLELIKGKRSTSECITQATNYIKHLQNKIKELDIKRDELEKFSISSSNSDHHDHGISSGSSSSSCSSSQLIIKVHPFSSGVEIVISTSMSREGTFPLSRVLELLVEEGLSINNCFSTTVNDRLHHTIYSDQVSSLETINLSTLEQKLAQVISSSSYGSNSNSTTLPR